MCQSWANGSLVSKKRVTVHTTSIDKAGVSLEMTVQLQSLLGDDQKSAAFICDKFVQILQKLGSHQII